MLALHALMPTLTERQAAHKVELDQFQDRAAEPGPGNLFEPMPQYAAISGGWKESGPAPSILHGAAVLGSAALGFGLALWWHNCRQTRPAKQQGP